VCRSKHVEPSINFGIINSITKLHLVGIFTEYTNSYFSSDTIASTNVQLLSDIVTPTSSLSVTMALKAEIRSMCTEEARQKKQ